MSLQISLRPERLAAFVIAIVVCLTCSIVRASGSPPVAQGDQARDKEIAARFAPVFYQGLGDNPRLDYFTNFDFDGDWRGDNNWRNAQDRRFPLKAYVYYSVCETRTHFFIHYAVFHPQDYKGGETHGALLSDLIREGVKHGGKYDPTGLSGEAALAHENDMEGCLVVVEKGGLELEQARVVHVETMGHDQFQRYVPESAGESGSNLAGRVALTGQRPRLYIEPRGHGIAAYRAANEGQTSKRRVLIYHCENQADDPDKVGPEQPISYDLLPLHTTLWPRARRGVNETYGATHDYGQLNLQLEGTNGQVRTQHIKLGRIGSAFLGAVGGRNRARPPWSWFDRDERARPLGRWFFDPAQAIRAHFRGEPFSTAYLRHPLVPLK